MDGKGGAVGGAPARPAIPNILIEATQRAIKEGMKPDELARSVAQSLSQESQSVDGSKSKKKNPRERHRAKSDDAYKVPDRTYRNFDERRMGFLVIGDQHRFTGGKAMQSIFPAAPPLDYSFCMINKIEEIVTENEQPQTTRNYRPLSKTGDERYRTSSLLLSYNVIDTIDGLINVLYKILDGGPVGLCWLDLSFNAITKLDEDTLSQLPNLKILYLHGNCIVDMTEIPKLQFLPELKSLTLHGNPLEQEEGYRIAVLFYLPRLAHLDFTAVTKSDKAASADFGKCYEPYWMKRHEELEAIYQARKKAAEITYTERMMAGGDELSDDD